MTYFSGVVLGMKPDKAQNTVGKNQHECLQKSMYRKSYKGTVSLATASDLKKFEVKNKNFKEKLKISIE